MTRPSFRDTLHRLGAAQKGAARSAPAYSRFVNRRLGRVFAALAHRAGLGPDAVTGLSAVFTFTGLALVALVPFGWPLGVAVTACLVVGYALDSADGQVARLTGTGGPAGEWLDHVVDAVKVVTLPLVVLIGFHRADVVPEGWLLVPVAGAVVSSVLFFAMILTEQMRRAHGVVSAAPSEGRGRWLRSVLVLPTDYGILCLTFVLLGAPRVFLGVYTFLVAATAGYLVLAAVKWRREIRALAA